MSHIIVVRDYYLIFISRSSLVYTSVRMALYADAFPIFMNWFPTTQTIYVPPNAGGIAYASREELGEVTAHLMLRPSVDFARKVVLLTGPEAASFNDLVKVINQTTNRNVRIQEVPLDEWVDKVVQEDQGGKGRAFFEKRVSWHEGVAKGDGETVDPLMGELLGREPKKGTEVIRELLEKDGNYTWHQNHVKRH